MDENEILTSIIRASLRTINLPDAVTLGGAYDEDRLLCSRTTGSRHF